MLHRVLSILIGGSNFSPVRMLKNYCSINLLDQFLVQLTGGEIHACGVVGSNPSQMIVGLFDICICCQIGLMLEKTENKQNGGREVPI